MPWSGANCMTTGSPESDTSISEREAQRLTLPQRCSRCGAGAADIDCSTGQGADTIHRCRFGLAFLAVRCRPCPDSIRVAIIQRGSGAQGFSPLIENPVSRRGKYPLDTA